MSAGQRHALVSVPLDLIISSAGGGTDAVQYRKILYSTARYSVHDSVVVLCRRINLPISLSARFLDAAPTREVARLVVGAMLSILLIASLGDPHATSRTQGPSHSTLCCSSPRCILTDMETSLHISCLLQARPISNTLKLHLNA